MRASVLLLLGALGLAACNSILGIQDHSLAPADGGIALDGSSGPTDAAPDSAPRMTDGGGDAGGDGGAVPDGATVVDSGCTPCTLGSATLGSCCVQ